MTVRSPFKPHYGSNQVVTPGAASASITISKDDKSLRVVNTGANIGYFRTGTGSVTASAADVPVPAGGSIVIEKPQEHDKLAHISASGTTFQVMTGEGGFV
ncbi:MAG: hypothetical protein ACM3WS_04995 [Bacillota bacterium]